MMNTPKGIRKKFVAIIVNFSIVCLIGFSEATAQTKKRQPVSTPKATVISPVVSRFIKAMQERDFKTIVELTYSYQVQLESIRQQNPRALWEKKTREFYDSKIGTLTQDASFWGDYSIGFGTLTGDPAQNFRAVAFFLPEGSTWKISETRKETVNSMIQGAFSQTITYVTISYPLADGKPVPPVLNSKFLKSTMLKFGVRGNYIENVYHVGELNVFWSPPYPSSAKEQLADRIKSDFLRGVDGSLAELEELIGVQELEVYLLEVAENPPENRVVFDWSLAYLTARHNKKAVPIIHRALEANTDYWQDSDLVFVKALKEIGPTEYPSVELLKKRLAIKLKRLDRGKDVQTLDDPAVWWHLDALTSLDNNSGWKSFPPNLLRKIIDELDDKHAEASFVAPEAKSKVTRFFSAFKPCEKGFSGRLRCLYDFDYAGVIVIDPWTMIVNGTINESPNNYSPSKPTGGTFQVLVYRTTAEPNKWLIKDIGRNLSNVSVSQPNVDVTTGRHGSNSNPVQDPLKIDEILDASKVTGKGYLAEQFLSADFVYKNISYETQVGAAGFLADDRDGVLNRNKKTSVKSFKCSNPTVKSDKEKITITKMCDVVEEMELVSSNGNSMIRASFKYEWINKLRKEKDGWLAYYSSTKIIKN
jgi:hypothetical protein